MKKKKIITKYIKAIDKLEQNKEEENFEEIKVNLQYQDCGAAEQYYVLKTLGNINL